MYAKHKEYIDQSKMIVRNVTTTLIFLSNECCNCKITLIKKNFTEKRVPREKVIEEKILVQFKLTSHNETR